MKSDQTNYHETRAALNRAVDRYMLDAIQRRSSGSVAVRSHEMLANLNLPPSIIHRTMEVIMLPMFPWIALEISHER